MTKKSGFSESQAKKNAASFLHGTKANGKPHQWVFGNQFGEVLPKFLMTKWQVREPAHHARACAGSTAGTWSAAGSLEV